MIGYDTDLTRLHHLHLARPTQPPDAGDFNRVLGSVSEMQQALGGLVRGTFPASIESAQMEAT